MEMQMPLSASCTDGAVNVHSAYNPVCQLNNCDPCINEKKMLHLDIRVFITYHVAWCYYDFIMSCLWRNIVICFVSIRFLSPPCPWQPKFWNYNGAGAKNKVVTLLSLLALKDAPWWQESKSGLRIEIRWQLPLLWAKIGRKLAKYHFCQFPAVFGQ